MDRDSRDRYLQALDQANDGALTPLGRLFAKLATRSIRRELEEPVPEPVPQTAIEVARAFVRSMDRREREEAERRGLAVHIRAQEIHSRIGVWFEQADNNLTTEFAGEGRTVSIWTDQATPTEPERSKWWHDQIIETAKRAEHFAAMFADRWWTMLGITVNGLRLRFVTSIHHVGSPRTGVMAVTAFGDIRLLHEGPSTHKDAFVTTSWDAFTFSCDEEVDDRAVELSEWLDQALAVALRKLMQRTLGS